MEERQQNSNRRWLRFFGLMLVCILHVPFLYLAPAEIHPGLVGLALATLAGGVFLSDWLREKAPAFFRFAGMAYFILVFLALSLPLFFWYLTDTVFLLTGAVLSAGVLVLKPGSRLNVIAFGLLVLASATKVAMLPVGLVVAIAVLWVALLLLGWLGALRNISRLCLATAVLGSFATLQIIAFFSGSPFWMEKCVKELSFVRPVFSIFHPDENVAEQLKDRTQVRFLSEDCSGDYFIVGTRKDFTGLFRISKSDHSKWKRIALDGGTSDNIAWKCPENSAVVGDFEGHRLLHVGMKPFQVIRETPLPGHRIGLLRFSEDYGSLYVACDLDNRIFNFDAETMEIRSQVVGNGHNAAMVTNRSGTVVYRAGFDGTLTRYTAPFLEETAKAMLKGAFFFWLTLDEKGDRLFATSTARGTIYELDPATLEERNRVDFQKGVRFSQYDAKRKLLYVGNYFTGDLLVVDPVTLKNLGRVYLGPRLRWVELGKAGNTLLVASGFGAFEVDLSGLMQYISMP